MDITITIKTRDIMELGHMVKLVEDIKAKYPNVSDVHIEVSC